MKSLYLLAHFLEYAKRKNWDGRPLWKVWLSQFVFWVVALFLIVVMIGVPVMEDFKRLDERKDCETQHGVKCEQRWVPISD